MNFLEFNKAKKYFPEGCKVQHKFDKTEGKLTYRYNINTGHYMVFFVSNNAVWNGKVLATQFKLGFRYSWVFSGLCFMNEFICIDKHFQLELPLGEYNETVGV